jgi:hypothetical protein
MSQPSKVDLGYIFGMRVKTVFTFWIFGQAKMMGWLWGGEVGWSNELPYHSKLELKLRLLG